MPEQHADAFERIDIDEPARDAVQRRLHIARYEFARSWVAGKRVLDIACGTGYGAAMAAQAGAASVVGVDIDQATIDQSRSRFSLPGLSFLVGDAERPPVDGPFDVILSFETIEHLRRPDRLLDAVQRLLAPGGVFMVSSPCRRSGSIDDRPQNPYHVREWNQAEFDDMLHGYFGRVVMHGQLIEFAKTRMPLNRTLARLATLITGPSRLRKLYSCDVNGLDSLPAFPLRIAYLVAVCSQPRN